MKQSLILRVGFKYTFEVLKRGVVIDLFDITNLMPTQGLNHMLSTVFKSGTPVATWYLGLYEGNYTPVLTDTAATFPGSATECTAYTASTRVAWVPGTVAAGVLDNSASKAEFVANATKTIYGGFMTSVAAKGAITGSLISAVRFPSPRVLDADSTLRVTAGITLTSA